MPDTTTPSTTVTLEAIGGEIQAAPHNDNYGDLEAAFGAHTHDLVADSVGDTELDAQRVRSVHASKKYALVSGRKSFSSLGTNFSKAITFSTDAAQGDPDFSAAPHVWGIVEYSAPGDYGAYVMVYGTVSTTGASFSIMWSDASTSRAAYLHWFAYGEVA